MLGRMQDDSLPRLLQFSQVSDCRSVGRPLLMWNDIARSDLTVSQENKWFCKCQR